MLIDVSLQPSVGISTGEVSLLNNNTVKTVHVIQNITVYSQKKKNEILQKDFRLLTFKMYLIKREPGLNIFRSNKPNAFVGQLYHRQGFCAP